MKSEAISILRLGSTNSETVELKVKSTGPSFSLTVVGFPLTQRIVTFLRGAHRKAYPYGIIESHAPTAHPSTVGLFTAILTFYKQTLCAAFIFSST